jgi:hypothetical protein
MVVVYTSIVDEEEVGKGTVPGTLLGGGGWKSVEEIEERL